MSTPDWPGSTSPIARITIRVASTWSTIPPRVEYALTPLGLNALRADLGSFFLASAIASALALFAGRANWMWGVACLYGLAVAGRFLGIVVDGAPEGIAQPVTVELVLVALSVFGARTLGRS